MNDDVCFDHAEWQKNVLKTEKYKAKLQSQMLESAVEVWEAEGEKVMKDSLAESPTGFIRALINLLPKKMDVNVNRTEHADPDSPRLAVLKNLIELPATEVKQIGTTEKVPSDD